MLTHGRRVVHPNFGGVLTAGGTPAAMPDAAAKKEG
jgi:hypothetical protein